MTMRAHINLFQTYLIFVIKLSAFLYHFIDTTWRPPLCLCDVTSYGLHLSATPLLRVQMTSESNSGQGLRILLIG